MPGVGKGQVAAGRTGAGADGAKAGAAAGLAAGFAAAFFAAGFLAFLVSAMLNLLNKLTGKNHHYFFTATRLG